jgi:hypothetical protein
MRCKARESNILVVKLCTQLGHNVEIAHLSSIVVLGQVFIVLTHEAFQLKLFRISYLAVACVWDRTGMTVGQGRAIESAFGIGCLAIGRRVCVVGVEAKKHVHDCRKLLVLVLFRPRKSRLTEEHKEGEAVQNQDVCNMGDFSLRQKQHLLFGGTQKEEATGIQQERRQELEAVGILSIFRDGVGVFQDETDFDDASNTSSHQGVAKDAVYHGTDVQRLSMTTHGPASNGDDDGRNQIALGTATAVAAEPHTHQTSAPPDDTHTGMLQIIMCPGVSPSVFSESVDTTPSSNDHAVVEFLRAAGATQPDLTNEEEDGVDDAVCDKCRAHDEVGSTLTGMLALAKAQGCDSTKQHLHPRGQRDDLAHYTVSRNNPLPDLAQEATLDVESKVDTHGGLSEDHHHQPGGVLRVYVLAELTAFVGVAEEVAQDSETGGSHLDGHMPSRADDAQHHASREKNAPCEYLYEDVDP